MYNARKHLKDWGHPKEPCLSTFPGTRLLNKAMLIVSADWKYAEDGKHPNIGSREDYQNVQDAAYHTPVIMGYNTLAANRYGINSPLVYIATRDPSKIDYGLPFFKKDQERILVTSFPHSGEIDFTKWSHRQAGLPEGVLILGGPALINEYLQKRKLHLLELTVSSHHWPNGEKAKFAVNFSCISSRINAYNEVIYNLVPNYA
jgi:dihydrofolate reductase